MFRILRAFAWMRWRMLVNSFEKTGSRDVLERFSIAAEKLGPIIAGLLIVPSSLVLLAGSAAAGYAVAAGDQNSLILVFLRYVLLFAPVAAILGPLFLPSGDRTNPVRFLLLPIPRSTIYVAQAAAAIGEPWIVLTLPILLGIPVGLLAGGALGGFFFAAFAGACLFVTIVGIAALSTTLLHLIVRDRRRAELLGVAFILVVSMAGFLPGLLQGTRQRDAEGKRVRRDVALPAWLQQDARRVLAVYPTELYLRSTRTAAAGHLQAAAAPALAIAGTALVVHVIGFLAFGRVLESQGSSGVRRGTAERAAWRIRLPGLSSGAAAVATAHLKLVARTTRGRTSLMSPLVILVVFSVLAFRRHGGMDFGSFQLEGGLPLALFTSFVSLVATLPIAMNQFAVDRAGLTMVLLSPLPEGEYLAGKAVGTALIALPLAFVCMVAAYVMFPAGSPALWLSVLLGLVATFLVVAPAAAVFSAMLPKLADLSSIGSKGNAHGLAGLLGLLSFVVGGAPCLVIVLLATRILDRPWLAPALLLVWCAVAFVVSRLLFVVALRIFLTRRENLATLVSRVLLPS